MRQFLIFILMFSPVMGWGQDDLYDNKKYVKPKVSDLCKSETDEFTQKVKITSETVKLGRCTEFGRRPVEAHLVNTGETTYLSLMPEFNTIQTISDGDIVYLKFKDGTVMELVVPNTSISNHTRHGTWYNHLFFQLTSEQILTIVDKPLLKLKCSIFTFEVKDKNSFALRDMVHCIWSKQ